MKFRRALIGSGLFLVLTMAARGAELQYSNVTVGVSVRLNAVAYGTNMFVTVGTNSTTVTSLSATNSLLDSDNWRTSSVPTTGVNLRAVTYGNGMFVAGGQNRVVYSSTDGTNWIDEGNAFSSATAITGLAFNSASNGTFVAVAQGALISWADAELAAWHVASIPGASFAEGYRSVTAFGTTNFAVCGLGGVIRVSRNAGGSWPVAGGNSYNASKPILQGIASDGGNKLVCVGTGGRIMVSTNGGTNWSTSDSKTMRNLNAVAYTGTGSEFVAAGDAGLILSSGDGVTWTSNATSVLTDLYGVAFAATGPLQGVGVIVGAAGTVIIAGERPAAPVSDGDRFGCLGSESPPLSVQVSNFVTVDWYAQVTGGIPLETSTTNFTPTPSLPGTNTYYAESRDTRTHFTSTNRTPVSLVISPPLLASVAASTNISAGNVINLNGVASGGTPPYAYAWSPTNFLDDPAVGPAVAMPPPGTTNLYTLIVTDAAGCTVTNQLTVTVNPVLNPVLTVSVAASTNICAGNVINLNGVASGGTPPYAYSWSPTNYLNDPAVGPAVATPPPGTTNLYTLIATDAAGHHATNQVTITVNALRAHITAYAPVCVTNLMNLNGSASGGSAPYSYAWSPSNYLDNATNQNVVSTPPPGTNFTYTLTVTDATGCQVTDHVVVRVGPRLLISRTNESVAFTWCGAFQLQYTNSLPFDPNVPWPTLTNGTAGVTNLWIRAVNGRSEFFRLTRP